MRSQLRKQFIESNKYYQLHAVVIIIITTQFYIYNIKIYISYLCLIHKDKYIARNINDEKYNYNTQKLHYSSSNHITIHLPTNIMPLQSIHYPLGLKKYNTNSLND